MKRTLTCIICPRGCTLNVEINGDDICVSGAACKNGEKYGAEECTHPTRTVTSIVRVANRHDTMVSVKTEAPVPKEDIFKVMEKIRAASVDAPIKMGDIILDDISGTKVIATKTIN